MELSFGVLSLDLNYPTTHSPTYTVPYKIYEYKDDPVRTHCWHMVTWLILGRLSTYSLIHRWYSDAIGRQTFGLEKQALANSGMLFD
jgi:hypothetical protein